AERSSVSKGAPCDDPHPSIRPAGLLRVLYLWQVCAVILEAGQLCQASGCIFCAALTVRTTRATQQTSKNVWPNTRRAKAASGQNGGFLSSWCFPRKCQTKIAPSLPSDKSKAGREPKKKR